MTVDLSILFYNFIICLLSIQCVMLGKIKEGGERIRSMQHGVNGMHALVSDRLIQSVHN